MRKFSSFIILLSMVFSCGSDKKCEDIGEVIDGLESSEKILSSAATIGVVAGAASFFAPPLAVGIAVGVVFASVGVILHNDLEAYKRAEKECLASSVSSSGEKSGEEKRLDEGVSDIDKKEEGLSKPEDEDDDISSF